MQILPSIPTDNFYKFIAITGVWLTLGTIIFLIYLGYLNYRLEIERIESNSYFRSSSTLRNVELRLKSIEEGKLTENILAWTPDFEKIEDERVFLEKLKDNNEKVVKEYEANEEIKAHEVLSIAEKMGLTWILPIYIFSSLICFSYGFKHWINKVQKPTDELLQLDIQIKKLTIKNMQRNNQNKWKNGYKNSS